jgi:magnesium transporter
VFSQLDLEMQAELAELEGRGEAVAELLEEMAPDDGADLVQQLDDELVEEILPLVDHEERAEIQSLAAYPPDTAGAVMTTDFVALDTGLTVPEAIEHLRSAHLDAETIYTIYVVDAEHRLIGVVSLRALVLASPETTIGELMTREVISVRVDEDQEEVADKIEQYDFLALPVVDEQEKLVGIITVDDVVDVIEEEAEEDIYRLAAAGAPQDYWRSSPFAIARQRIVWLLVLVLAGLCSAGVMKGFENLIELHAFALLALFVPLVAGSSGNTGTQAGTTVVRGLGTGEIDSADLPRLLVKEITIGVMVGVALAICGGLAGWMLGGWRLASAVGLAMLIAIVAAKASGAVFPVLFRRLGFDPALMSAPLIATVIDIGSIALYLGLGHLIYM